MSEATAEDVPARRPWWRRLLRALFLAIFWPLVFVGVLLASTIFHLDSAPARRELCDRVEPILDGDMIADIVPTFGSVNMIGGECDR